MPKISAELEDLIDGAYVPSSVERKKAVLMYFFIGIVTELAQDEMSIYEYFHLKQSLGRWTLFFVSLVCFSPFIFFWRLRVVPALIFLCMVIIRVIFMKQAWEGRYTINNGTVLLPIFHGFGEWMTNIFELDVKDEDE